MQKLDTLDVRVISQHRSENMLPWVYKLALKLCFEILLFYSLSFQMLLLNFQNALLLLQSLYNVSHIIVEKFERCLCWVWNVFNVDLLHRLLGHVLLYRLRLHHYGRCFRFSRFFDGLRIFFDNLLFLNHIFLFVRLFFLHMRNVELAENGILIVVYIVKIIQLLWN